MPFHINDTPNVANLNVYAKVFGLGARNNTGPFHYVDNAGRMYKVPSKGIEGNSVTMNILNDNIEQDFNGSLVHTSASVIIGEKNCFKYGPQYSYIG